MGRWLAVGAAASLGLPSSVSHSLTLLTAQCNMSLLGPSRTSPAFSCSVLEETKLCRESLES